MAKLNREDLELQANELVKTAYSSYKNRTGLEDMWRRWDAYYNMVLDASGKQNYEGTSKLFPPDMRRALQTIADFIIDVIFPPTADWYRIEGVDGDADIKNAEVYKKIGDLQDEKIVLRAKVIKGVYRWLKYGFLIVKFPYVFKDKHVIADDKDRKTIKSMLKDFMSGKAWNKDGVPEKKTRAVYDNIDFQPKSPWNMFWDYYTPWEDQQIIIEKIDNVTASHLKAQKRAGVYNDNVDKVIEYLKTKQSTGKDSDDTDTDHKFPHNSLITGLSGNFNDGKQKTTLLQADCWFDIDQDGYDELCVITIATLGTDKSGNIKDSVVIRMEVNPCELQEMPYGFVAWDELEDQSLGMGIPQITEKDQLGLNDFTNQAMDNITEIMNPTRVYDGDMIKEGQNLNTWPRKTIRVSGSPRDIIDFIRPPDIGQAAMAGINMMKANIQNGSRANVSLQGLSARYDTTASEYSKQGNAASRGIMCQIKNLEDAILKPFKRFQYAYNLQFLERETLVSIIGKKAAKAMLTNPEDPAGEQKSPRDVIAGDYDFKILGVTQMENKVIHGQQLINFLDIAMKIPGVFNIPLIGEKIWNTIGDGDNRMVLPQITDPTMDPNDENILMSQGAAVSITMNDNDQEHLSIHMPLQLIPEFMKNKTDHIKEHLMSMQKKQMAAMQQQSPLAGGQQQPAFAPKMPMPGNNGAVPGVVAPPAGMVE